MNRARPMFRWGCLCSLCLIILVGVVLVWVWIESQRGWSVSRLESLIAVEVPATADRATVEKWFDAKGISHSYYADTTGDRAGPNTMPMLAGLRDEDLSGMVRGWIDGPQANVGFFNSGRITVY